MTEKDAIGYLEYMEDWNEDDAWLSDDTMKEFVKCCKKVFSEVQQYRDMELKRHETYGPNGNMLSLIVNRLCKHDGIEIGKPVKARLLTDEDVDKWEQYKAIGTVEECREAVSRIKTQKYYDKVYEEIFVINSNLAKYFFEKNMMVFKLYDNDYRHITYLDELLEHSARGGLFGIEKYDLDEII